MNDWFFNANKLRKLVDEVPDPLKRELMAARWEECVHISKAKPVNKSSYFPAFKVVSRYPESPAKPRLQNTRDG